MVVIADSSLLIGMVRIAQFKLLKKLYRQVFIPPSVYQEVIIEGRRLSKAGVEEIDKGIQSGWIKVVSLTKSQLNNSNMYRASGRIGKGEAEVIALARSRQLPIILDDNYARELAAALRLNYMGTAAVLLEAYFKGLLSKKEFAESLRELGKVMWLSPEVVAELLRLAEEVNK